MQDWNEFLEMAQIAPLSTLMEVLPTIRKRVLGGLEDGSIADVVQYLKDLPTVAGSGGTKQKVEAEPEPELEPEPEPKTHPGNLRLLEALHQKQDEMGLDDDRFTQFVEFFLENMSANELMELLEESTDPVPNSLLSGPLPKILSTSSAHLYVLRDGEGGEDGLEGSKEKIKNPSGPSSRPRPSSLSRKRKS
jgi:hypothetical protein